MNVALFAPTLVEVLAALRDAERGCYATTAPPTAPLEWHRLLREAEHRIDLWIKRMPCSRDRGHEEKTMFPDAKPLWVRSPKQREPDMNAYPPTGRRPSTDEESTR